MQILVAIAVFVVLVLLLRVAMTRGERPRAAPALPAASTLTDDSIRELLLDGRKIEAIKAYRMLHGGGLAEAKRAVEDLAERRPSST